MTLCHILSVRFLLRQKLQLKDLKVRFAGSKYCVIFSFYDAYPSVANINPFKSLFTFIIIFLVRLPNRNFQTETFAAGTRAWSPPPPLLHRLLQRDLQYSKEEEGGRSVCYHVPS